MWNNNHHLFELCKHLKQERLFTNAEREQLQKLHEDSLKSNDKIHSLSWTTRQQKNVLNDLIRANAESTSATCCHRSSQLEQAKFVDGYKRLSYHESKLGDFLRNLRQQPQTIAALLIEAEKDGTEKLQLLVQIVVASIYNNLVLAEDEYLALQVLKALLEQQFSVHPNPRRLLRKESCAFAVFFKFVIEGMFSARLFLTGALYQPIVSLLMEDEWFYDIDPDRALHRFPSAERQRRFGQADTAEYYSKLNQYRDMIVTKLFTITDRFISSLRAQMFCFPLSLAWIVAQMYRTLAQREQIGENEAKSACADLVLALFISPAMCEPEPYGIIADLPISYVARHNLMQVAQILQVLSLGKIDDVDAKQKDIYSKWDKGCMDFLLASLLETPCSDLPPKSSAHSYNIERRSVYMTFQELLFLLQLAQDVPERWHEPSLVKSLLCELIGDLPPVSKLEELQEQHKLTPSSTPTSTPPGTPQSSRKQKGKEKNSLRLPAALKHKDHLLDVLGVEDSAKEVLVISLSTGTNCPGMDAEDKVIDRESRQKKKLNSLIPGMDDPVSESDILANQKRTRFSLSQDQDSIATSDNLEGSGSDSASSHSIGSDIENIENLSDMVSANVSGRGTPSISGRESPESESAEDVSSQLDAASDNQEGRGRGLENVPVVVQKSNREDVTDKFQKFEIQQELERDDIKSTVSDSWSTDVLASDSEPPEQNQLERLVEVNEERLPVPPVSEAGDGHPDTASDGWSMDVLASDTSELPGERLLELDQEDFASVSGRSQTVESETGEYLDNAAGLPDSVSVSSAGGSSDHRSDILNDDSPRSSGSAANQAMLERFLLPKPAPRQTVSAQVSRSTSADPPTPLVESEMNGCIDPLQVLVPVANGEDSEAVKPQDQQNLHLDIQRLSLSAVAAFDPLVVNGAADGGGSEGLDLSAELATMDITGSAFSSTEDLVAKNSQQASYMAQGARPKQPKLKVVLNDQNFATPVRETGGRRGVKDFETAEDEARSSERKKPKSSSFFSTFRERLSRKADTFGSPVTNFKGHTKRRSAKPEESKNSILNNMFYQSPGNQVDGRAPEDSAGALKTVSNSPDVLNAASESSDDILAKYRHMTVKTPDHPSERFTKAKSRGESVAEDLVMYDPSNLENCQAFIDSKKKLRLVLSSVDISSAAAPIFGYSGVNGPLDSSKESELLLLLKCQLAEALNLQDKQTIIQLQETIRCLKIFSNQEIKRLLRVLKEEHQTRSVYTSYLLNTHQSMLMTQAHMNKLLARLKSDKMMVNKALLTTCVRLYLQSKEQQLGAFISRFQKLSAADEKTDHLESYLQQLFKDMYNEPTWQVCSEEQLSEARWLIERYLMTHVYSQAIFPNGDGDLSRDQIFQQHISELSSKISPNHRDFRIPRNFHQECPWPAAQSEIIMINAYKTAKDKLQCVLRTCNCIMNLLSLACEGSAPAADDFIPVLIYVLVAANPPHLLSTVQFVENFYGKRLEGEEMYYWTQFTSAVLFIKTIDARE